MSKRNKKRNDKRFYRDDDEVRKSNKDYKRKKQQLKENRYG